MAPQPQTSLEAAVHLIQVALTPIFLLSGIAALLNVFAARLARVADRLDHLTAELRTTAHPAQTRAEIHALHGRSLLLDLAVVLSTTGATSTCLAILTLFFLAISTIDISNILLFFFGLAIVCTLMSAALFGWEMLSSSKALRARMRLHVPGIPRFRLHAAEPQPAQPDAPHG